jgi:tRNA threonylcarbamoyladenosine biosynthesis protein TsaE
MSIVGKKYTFELDSEASCQLLANKLSLAIDYDQAQKQALQIWFCGDLGSGKTTFIRYFLRALSFDGKVKSPTYNLCEPYQIYRNGVNLSIHHFDLYRMNHATEWEEAGFKDILTSPGINLIEWPEQAENTLPSPDLVISLEYISEYHRRGEIAAHSILGQNIILKL